MLSYFKILASIKASCLFCRSTETDVSSLGVSLKSLRFFKILFIYNVAQLPVPYSFAAWELYSFKQNFKYSIYLVFGCYLRGMSSCFLVNFKMSWFSQWNVHSALSANKRKSFLKSRHRYYFQESWYLFLNKKGLHDRNITCSKSKWMPQVCIFVILNDVFSIHHGLFFLLYFFFCTKQVLLLQSLLLINFIKPEWFDFRQVADYFMMDVI